MTTTSPISSCPECGASMARALVPFRFEGEYVGQYEADVCENGHDFFTEASAEAIERFAR